MTIKEKIQKFQEEFNPHFIKEVTRLMKEQKEFHATHLDEHIEKSLINYCKTGKRIRPFLIYFFSQKELEDNDILHLTLASELFHLAALLQDDVMDGSLVRRNVPTLNAIGDDLAQNNKHLGDHFGILLGDVFWTSAMEHAALLPKDVFKEFMTMIQRTVRGQYLDVIGMNEEYGTTSRSDVLARHDLKTAWYTFTSPARLGCMLNESHTNEILADITPVVRELGLLFQIRDDIMDCIDEQSGKELFGDIFENQTTWVTLYVKEQYPEKFNEIILAKESADTGLLKNIFNTIDLHAPYQVEFDKRRELIKNMNTVDTQLQTKAQEVLELLYLK